MRSTGDFFPRLRGLLFALSIIALFVTCGGLVIADETAILEGLDLNNTVDGQDLVIQLSGRVDYELNPLAGNRGIQVNLPDCELGSLFAVPALNSTDLISRIDYKLSLLKGVKSVMLIITFPENLQQDGTMSVEQVDGDIVVSMFKNKTTHLLVSPYGAAETETNGNYSVDGIEVSKLDDRETVVVKTSSACEPRVRTAAFPFRVILEYEGGETGASLENYSYDSNSGLIHQIDVDENSDGSVRVTITAPDAGRFLNNLDGSSQTVTVFDDIASPVAATTEAPRIAEPAEIKVPEPAAEKPVELDDPAVEVKEVNISPKNNFPKPLDYGSMDLAGEVSDYPELPVVTEAYGEGEYYFPTEEPSTDKKHISDALVSLNFENANFIDVMMILASQAGVDFVLDAYWNQAPTGHIRERPPGGPGGGGFGGGMGSGGSFAPVGGFGSVTLQVTNRTFDEVFQMLMLQNSLDFEVFRASPDAEPIVFISTRERLQQEMGLGVVKIYQTHYIEPDSAFYFLQTMDLIPSTSGYGWWFYGGGGGNSGGGGQGGTGGGSSGGRGGGSSSGGGRRSIGNGGFTNPVNALDPISVIDTYPSAFNTLLPANEPFQIGTGGGGGGGTSGGGGGGGQGGGGGGQGGAAGGGLYTAKTGAIGVMATQEMHDMIKDALDQIDKPPKQIFVETTFLSVDVNPEQRPDVYGVDNLGDYAYQYGADRFRWTFDAVNNEGMVFEVLPKNQTVPYDDFRARYKWLYFDRKVKIVSSPRVAVIEGFTGTVNVTENRPFIIDGGVIIDQFGNAIPAPDQVTFVPTGTTLSITPYIDDFGNITMFLNPTNSSLLGEPQLIEGNLVFGTVQTSVNTILRLRDGETIVLGGMTQNSEDVEKQMIPFLGELPIIGVLFGRTERQKVDSQLVILLTTHIVGS